MCKVAENRGAQGTSSRVRRVRGTPPYAYKPSATGLIGFFRIFSTFLPVIDASKRARQHNYSPIPNNTRDREIRARVNARKRAAMLQIMQIVAKIRKFAVKSHSHPSNNDKPLTCIVLMSASQRYVPIRQLLPATCRRFNDKGVRGVRNRDIKGLASYENATSRKTIEPHALCAHDSKFVRHFVIRLAPSTFPYAPPLPAPRPSPSMQRARHLALPFPHATSDSVRASEADAILSSSSRVRSTWRREHFETQCRPIYSLSPGAPKRS